MLTMVLLFRFSVIFKYFVHLGSRYPFMRDSATLRQVMQRTKNRNGGWQGGGEGVGVAGSAGRGGVLNPMGG